METGTLKKFFMWCTIMNGGLLLFWSFLCLFALDWIYNMHSIWFQMPRETFNIVMYSFLGAFKLFVIGCNLVPYLALVIMERRKPVCKN